MRLTLCEARTHETKKDHDTGTGTSCAIIFARSAWVLYITSPANQYRENAGDGA